MPLGVSRFVGPLQRGTAVLHSYCGLHLMPYYIIQAPRATVQTQTSLAPAASRTLAHSLVVAPVVNTSSIRTNRSPLRRLPRCILNALRRFDCRSALDSRVCVFVATT